MNHRKVRHSSATRPQAKAQGLQSLKHADHVTHIQLVEYLKPLTDRAVAGMVDVVQPEHLSGTTAGIAIYAFKCPITARDYLRYTARAAHDLHNHGFITQWEALTEPFPEEEAPESNTGPQAL